MRVITGIYGGRHIGLPSTFTARPTTDFAKEALFNILAGLFDFDDIAVLDLYAGSGAIGFEFASRGAQRIDSVDTNPVYCRFIQKTVQAWNISQMYVHNQQALAYIKHCSQHYNIVFADPPYKSEDVEALPNAVLNAGIMKHKAWLILEHDAGHNFALHANFQQHRRYGSVNFSVFAKDSVC